MATVSQIRNNVNNLAGDLQMLIDGKVIGVGEARVLLGFDNGAEECIKDAIDELEVTITRGSHEGAIEWRHGIERALALLKGFSP